MDGFEEYLSLIPEPDFRHEHPLLPTPEPTASPSNHENFIFLSIAPIILITTSSLTYLGYFICSMPHVRDEEREIPYHPELLMADRHFV